MQTTQQTNDQLVIGGHALYVPLYPGLREILPEAHRVRRPGRGGGDHHPGGPAGPTPRTTRTSWTTSPRASPCCPNTSGARNADEAVRIARLARELGCGDFVKIEIMHDSKYLLPDNYETVRATETLAKEGFIVLPYMYPDLKRGPGPGERRRRGGDAPGVPPSAPTRAWPPGTSSRFSSTRSTCPSSWTRASARPSQACEAMEMGAAAIMANTALATAGDLPLMASRLPQGHRGRPAGVPLRPGPGAGPGRGGLRPSHRLPAGLRGRTSWKIRKTSFFVDSEFLSPKALEIKHRLETDPLQPHGPHGLSPRHGAHPVGRDGQGDLPDERLRPGAVHRPGRGGGPAPRDLLHRGLQSPALPGGGAVSGADGPAGPAGDPEALRQHGLPLHAPVHRQLL